MGSPIALRPCLRAVVPCCIDRVYSDHLIRHHLPVQRERARVVHLHVHGLADQAVGAVEDDDVVGHAAAGELLHGRVASSAQRLGPSTSTSTTLPICARWSARLFSVWIASRSLLRRFFTTSATSSG